LKKCKRVSKGRNLFQKDKRTRSKAQGQQEKRKKGGRWFTSARRQGPQQNGREKDENEKRVELRGKAPDTGGRK